jgi:dihydrolipoamide dehydrogenase
MQKYDCIIIGAGPGGYVAAIRASQLGLSTAIIERSKLGGQCLNWGCIPSKTLMESAKLFQRITKASSFGISGVNPKELRFEWDKVVKRKDKIVTKLVRGVGFLMKKNGIDVIEGNAVIEGPTRVKVDGESISCNNILLSTGAIPDESAFADLPAGKMMLLPEFYALTELPEKIVIFGVNPAACETASMLAMGGFQVTMIGNSPRILPALDEHLSNFVLKKLKKLKIKIILSIDKLQDAEGGVNAGDEFVACNWVINCADRCAVIPEFTGMKPECNAQGFLKVDEFCQTTVKGIYAAGDLTGRLWAQSASAMGCVAVNNMCGAQETMDYNAIPANMYLDPEIACVGKTETELKESGIEYRIGEFSLSANGKALAEGNTEGFVRVFASEENKELLGVQIVATNATDLISEAVTHIKLEATLEEIAETIHPHPSVSEVFWEASLDALSKPIHK